MHDDVSPDRLKELDKADMMGAVTGFADQMQRALESARGAEFTPPRTVKRVLVAGLGGSAMGGDLVAAWADAEGTAPVAVNRTYGVPKWVDEDTLVLCVSYSGNTEETLSAFVEAKERGAMLAAVSSGGQLKQFAERVGCPYLQVEGGMQPRAALPTTFVPQAVLLGKAGVLPNVEAGLEEAIEVLKPLVQDLGPDASPNRNEGKRIALALRDTVPAVYAADFLAPIARRWSNQFNENGKVLSFWGVMPEMNHNELVGWGGDDDLDRFTAILLRHDGEHEQVKTRFDFTARLIQERGGRVVQVQSRGEGLAARMLSPVVAGDAASVYLAALRGLDPTPVDVIQKLKAHVGESGFGKELEARLS